MSCDLTYFNIGGFGFGFRRFSIRRVQVQRCAENNRNNTLPRTRTHIRIRTHTKPYHVPICVISAKLKPYHIRKMSTLPTTSEGISALHPVKSAYLSADDLKTSADSSALLHDLLPFPASQPKMSPCRIFSLATDRSLISSAYSSALSLYPVCSINFPKSHRTQRRTGICRPVVGFTGRAAVNPRNWDSVGEELGKCWDAIGTTPVIAHTQSQVDHLFKIFNAKLTTSKKLKLTRTFKKIMLTTSFKKYTII